MQSDGELPAAHPRELPVDPRLGVIESPADSVSEALRETAHRCLIGKPYFTAAQSISIIDPHLVWCRDQHIGDALCSQ